MPRFGISLEREKELIKRMNAMKVFERDLVESFIRSSGPGGQNVNKVSTCVFLKHPPSGIEVKCQSERSQGQNRYRARCLLMDKIARKKYQEKLKKIQEDEKKRRQKRKRSKRMKEDMLEKKRKQSAKKELRQRIHPHKLDKHL